MPSLRWFAALFALALVLPIGGADGQGAYNKAAFEKTMEETNKQARRMLTSMIGGDWGMTKSSAEAIADEAVKIRELTPRVEVDRIDEFRAHADSLNSQAARLATAAGAKDAAEASILLGKIVSNCVTCHGTFRK